MEKFLREGQVLRYSKPYRPSVRDIDGYPNFHFIMHGSQAVDKMLLLESGINRVAIIETPESTRRPLLLLRSSLWKAGTESTPWTDEYDPANRRITFFGDHKVTTKGGIGATPGNRALQELWPLHSSAFADERAAAPPIFVFRAKTVRARGGKEAHKGYVEFYGVTRMLSLRDVTQADPDTKDLFPNLEAALQMVDLSKPGLDLRWVDDRRNPAMTNWQALTHAPTAWKAWVTAGE